MGAIGFRPFMVNQTEPKIAEGPGRTEIKQCSSLELRGTRDTRQQEPVLESVARKAVWKGAFSRGVLGPIRGEGELHQSWEARLGSAASTEYMLLCVRDYADLGGKQLPGCWEKSCPGAVVVPPEFVGGGKGPLVGEHA